MFLDMQAALRLCTHAQQLAARALCMRRDHMRLEMKGTTRHLTIFRCARHAVPCKATLHLYMHVYTGFGRFS